MTKDNGCLFAGGPPLVKQALGLDIDKLALGGVDVHARTSGLIDNAASDDERPSSRSSATSPTYPAMPVNDRRLRAPGTRRTRRSCSASSLQMGARRTILTR